MTAFALPIYNATVLTDQGLVNAGGLVWTYFAGSTTPVATYTDASQTVACPNPIVLNSAGRFPTEVWVSSGTVVKLVYQTTNGVPLTPSVYDFVSGINDVTLSNSISEWIQGTSPTFVSTTSFSVAGNQTSVYTLGRRVKGLQTSGVVYGTVTDATFTTVTSITVTLDNGDILDSGLSSIFYGMFDPSHPSYGTSLTTNNVYTGSNSIASVALLESSPIVWDTNTAQNATLTLTTSQTMGAPSGGIAGKYVALRITQGGTGRFTITWNAAFKMTNNPVTLSSGASAVDFLCFRFKDTTSLELVSYKLNIGA